MADQATKARARAARYEQRTSRKTVLVRFTPAELAALDAIRRGGETRSAAIRRAIEALRQR